jgi:hypothetical protein
MSFLINTLDIIVGPDQGPSNTSSTTAFDIHVLPTFNLTNIVPTPNTAIHTPVNEVSFSISNSMTVFAAKDITVYANNVAVITNGVITPAFASRGTISLSTSDNGITWDVDLKTLTNFFGHGQVYFNALIQNVDIGNWNSSFGFQLLDSETTTTPYKVTFTYSNHAPITYVQTLADLQLTVDITRTWSTFVSHPVGAILTGVQCVVDSPLVCKTFPLQGSDFGANFTTLAISSGLSPNIDLLVDPTRVGTYSTTLNGIPTNDPSLTLTLVSLGLGAKFGFYVEDFRFSGCPDPFELGLQNILESLSAATQQLESAITIAQPSLDDFTTSVANMIVSTDEILSSSINPEVTTTASLATALGRFPFDTSTNQEATERRLSTQYGFTLVDGIIFLPGTIDLSPIQRLATLLGIISPTPSEATVASPNVQCYISPNLANTSGTTCDLSQLRTLLQDRMFIMVCSILKSTTVETTNSAGEPVINVNVAEQLIGTNISIAQAAQIAGVPPSDIEVKIFWLDEISSDKYTVQRLQSFGVVNDDLATALLGLSNTRLTSYTIAPRDILTLLSSRGLSDSGICKLLSRPPITIQTEIDSDAVQQAINDILFSPGGSSTEGVPLNESAGSLLMNSIDLPASLGVPQAYATAIAELLANQDQVNKEAVGVSSTGTSSPIHAKQTIAKNCLTTANYLLQLTNQAAKLQRTFGSALAPKSIDLGSKLQTILDSLNGTLPCLAALGLGYLFSGSIGFSLTPAVTIAVSLSSKVMQAIDRVLAALQAALCIPLAFLDAIIGGVCGLGGTKSLCASNSLAQLAALIRQIINMMLNLAISTVAQLRAGLGFALQLMLGLVINLGNTAICNSAIASMASQLASLAVAEL